MGISALLKTAAPLAGPVGVGLAVGSEIYGGLEAARAGKETEALSEYNAAVSESQAKQVEAVTGIKQQRAAEEASRTASTIEAGLGAAGAVTTAGSPLMIQAKQASESELENLMIGYEGAAEAGKYRSAAAMERWQGKMARKAGKRQMWGKFIGAGGTVLSGFAGAKAPAGGNAATTGTKAQSWLNEPFGFGSP